MTPWSSGSPEGDACGCAGSFRRYRDENPPKWTGVGGAWRKGGSEEVDICPLDSGIRLKSMEGKD